MAIPFLLPNEAENNQSDDQLEQLLCDLIYINGQIQILLRERMQNRVTSNISPRVCTSPRHSFLHHHQPAEAEVSMLPDLVLSSLPNVESRMTLPTGQNLSMPTMIRARRQRTTDASSCCEHAKIGVCMVHHDVQQVTDDFNKSATTCKDPWYPSTSGPPSLLAEDQNIQEDDHNEDKSLLSKLMPTTTSSRSIWTAVICVVGWHIFRAR